MHGVSSSLVNSSKVFSPLVPLMEGSPSKKDSLASDGVVLVRRRAERGFCRLSREPALDIELNPVVTRFTIEGLPPPMCSSSLSEMKLFRQNILGLVMSGVDPERSKQRWSGCMISRDSEESSRMTLDEHLIVDDD